MLGQWAAAELTPLAPGIAISNRTLSIGLLPDCKLQVIFGMGLFL